MGWGGDAVTSLTLIWQRSHLLGLLVAPMTMTWERAFKPSMRVSSWETIRRSTSPWCQEQSLSAPLVKCIGGDMLTKMQCALVCLAEDTLCKNGGSHAFNEQMHFTLLCLQ